MPQNGQISFCLAGLHSACAPQAGQACFSSAGISVDIEGVWLETAWLFCYDFM